MHLQEAGKADILTTHCCQCSLAVSFMFKLIKKNWTYSQIIHFPLN